MPIGLNIYRPVDLLKNKEHFKHVKLLHCIIYSFHDCVSTEGFCCTRTPNQSGMECIHAMYHLILIIKYFLN